VHIPRRDLHISCCLRGTQTPGSGTFVVFRSGVLVFWGAYRFWCFGALTGRRACVETKKTPAEVLLRRGLGVSLLHLYVSVRNFSLFIESVLVPRVGCCFARR
jgi:hypothetical protein